MKQTSAKYVFVSLFILLVSPTLAHAAQPPGAVQRCEKPNQAVAYLMKVVQEGMKQDGLVEALRRFPKGADLHNHLSGTVMPEDYLAMAQVDGACYCKDPDDPDMVKIVAAEAGECKEPRRPLAKVTEGERNKVMRSLSMLDFPSASIQSGHDQFFATFGRFSPVSNAPWNTAPMLVKLLRQAHNDGVSYVETMTSFQGKAVEKLASTLRGNFKPEDWENPDKYPQMYDLLRNGGLPDSVADAQKEIDRYVSDTEARLRCDSSQPEPACNVSYRFIASVNRNATIARAPSDPCTDSSKDPTAKPDPAKVFAQAALSFALAKADEMVVGVNLLSGEDAPASMASFKTQMKFFKYFNSLFPDVNVALHAGELTPCFTGEKNEALKDHLVASLEAGAKRIGHGVSFAYLDDKDKEKVAAMFKQYDAAVEIMFTSNAQILGVAGTEHPFLSYRKHQIPMMFSTDDEGVSYADYTSEWIYGFVNYGLTGKDLVRLARESLQRAFLEGDALWINLAAEKPVDPCADIPLGTETTTKACQEFLDKSAKAKAQWRLERDLASYFKGGGTRYAQLLRMNDVARYVGR